MAFVQGIDNPHREGEELEIESGEYDIVSGTSDDGEVVEVHFADPETRFVDLKISFDREEIEEALNDGD